MNFKQLYERLIQKAASSVNNIADTVSTDITDKATDIKPIVLKYNPILYIDLLFIKIIISCILIYYL